VSQKGSEQDEARGTSQNLCRPDVPKWLADLGLKPGEYYTSGSKPKIQAAMRPRFPLKARIWACLLYHTEPYKTERATTMFRGKKVSLRPANIATELYEVAIDYYKQSGRELTDEEKKAERIDRANIRRILAELENEGFCERRTF